MKLKLRKDREKQQEMEQQFADMKAFIEKQTVEAEQRVLEVQEAWQDANERASQAEARTRELEKVIMAREELQRQPWPPPRSGVPAEQVVGDSGVEPNECDMDVNEVKILFDYEMYCTTSSL
jgi:chromosome segregation ATPase